MSGTQIALVAGRVKVPDRVGHHDYRAGCKLLARMLEQTPGVSARVFGDDWPVEPAALDGARCVVFYARGGGRQPFLRSDERLRRMQDLADRGVGFVLLHQAVDVRAEHLERALRWFGGATLKGYSERGHWHATHSAFPEHAVTRGVEGWSAEDGWICGPRLAPTATPLLWARPARELADVVAWAFSRADGGRSVCFSGLDSHPAWAADGLRRLLVNSVLWSAGLDVPAAGATCAVDAGALARDLTSRGSHLQRIAAALSRRLRRRSKGRRG